VILRLGAVGLALATAAGGVAVAVRDPWPVAARSAAPADAPRLAVAAATPAVTCTGPETSIAPQGSLPSDSAGVVTLTAAADGAGAAGAALGQLGAGAASPSLAGNGVRAVELGAAVRDPLRLAAGTDADQTRLAAVQTTLVRSGDRRGLAAEACPAATTDAWLVGGATSTGRRARLLLLDPTPAAAVVDVVVLGPRGVVDLPSARGIVVTPGRARALQLDALAPGLDRLAVHVVARRGRVAAVLDDSRLDGATPAGVDDVPVAAPAARHLTLPGVVVPAVPPGATATAVVRVAVPGAEDAVVHVHLAGPQGNTPLRGSGVVTVPAGSVVDVPLTGLAAGDYAVLADADVPVVAGALVRVAGAPAGPLRRSAADVGWTAAALPVTGDARAALPRPVGYGTHGRGPAARTLRLTLTAAEAAAAVMVRQFGAHGEPLARAIVRVPAHRTTAVTLLPAAAAVALRTGPGSPVWAGVAATTPDPSGPMLSLLPVPPPPAPDHATLAAVADPWLPAQSSQSSSLP
jgi:Family of unknown function (DUF5719)